MTPKQLKNIKKGQRRIFLAGLWARIGYDCPAGTYTKINR